MFNICFACSAPVKIILFKYNVLAKLCSETANTWDYKVDVDAKFANVCICEKLD